ncbi:MAG: hypothetical protein KF823_02930 [Xanthomonadales bacterium]|nr:hypothetical protein [Xanthomonadales bacterium]
MRNLLLAALLAPILTAAPVHGQDWTLIGPDGGRPESLHVPDPNGQVAYALAQTGLFRSDDRARQWSRLRLPGSASPPGRLMQVATSSRDPALVLLTDGTRVYRSGDGGGAWTQVQLPEAAFPGLSQLFIAAIAVDAEAPGRIAVFRVMRRSGSSNQRETWLWLRSASGATEVDERLPSRAPHCGPPVPNAWEDVTSAAFAQGTLYYTHLYDCRVAGIHFPPAEDGPALRLHQWNGELSLRLSGEMPGSGLRASSDLLVQDGDLFVRGQRHAWRMARSGQDAVAIADDARGLRLPGDGSVVRLTGDAALRSTDRGQTWARIDTATAGLDGVAGARPWLVAGFTQPTAWLLGNDDGLFHAPGADTAWQRNEAGIGWSAIRALTVHPAEPQRIWAGAGESIFTLGERVAPHGRVAWHSSDGGASWRTGDLHRRAAHLRALAVDADPALPGPGVVLYAAGAGCPNVPFCVSGMIPGMGLFKSVDGGSSWTHMAGDLFTPGGGGQVQRSLAVDVWRGTPASRRLLATHTQLLHSMVLRSADAGSSWQGNTQGLPGYLPGNSGSDSMDVRFAANPPGRAYLATVPNSHLPDQPPGQPGGVFRSDDAGASWTPASSGLPSHPGSTVSTGVVALAVDPANGDRLWAISNESDANGQPANRVFASDDGGRTWRPAHAGLPPGDLRAILADPASPGVVHVGGNAGVWTSRNGGAAWQRLGGELPGVVLALAASQDQVFAGGTFGLARLGGTAQRPPPCLRRTPRGAWCGQSLQP